MKALDIAPDGLTEKDCSADFQVCCVAGFQTRKPSGRPTPLENLDALPIWKSAIQQVWKPALQPEGAT